MPSLESLKRETVEAVEDLREGESVSVRLSYRKSRDPSQVSDTVVEIRREPGRKYVILDQKRPEKRLVADGRTRAVEAIETILGNVTRIQGVEYDDNDKPEPPPRSHGSSSSSRALALPGPRGSRVFPGPPGIPPDFLREIQAFMSSLFSMDLMGGLGGFGAGRGGPVQMTVMIIGGPPQRHRGGHGHGSRPGFLLR